MLGDKMLLEEFFDAQRHTIDTSYYVKSFLMHPLDQIVSTCFPDISEDLRDPLYRNARLNKPVEAIYRFTHTTQGTLDMSGLDRFQTHLDSRLGLC